MRAYARSRLRSWQAHGRGTLIGPVRLVRGATPGAGAAESDRAYGFRARGLIAFLAAGPDIFRIECTAPARRFGDKDSRIFWPLVKSFSAGTG